jgi:hypothetical protein
MDLHRKELTDDAHRRWVFTQQPNQLIKENPFQTASKSCPGFCVCFLAQAGSIPQ